MTATPESPKVDEAREALNVYVEVLRERAPNGKFLAADTLAFPNEADRRVVEAMLRFRTRAAEAASQGEREAGPTADELEASGKAPWLGEQPIEDDARYWKGRPWVPLEIAIKKLQFWQRRDYEHGRLYSLAAAQPTAAAIRADEREAGLAVERRILAVECAAIADVKEAMKPFVRLIDRIESLFGWGCARNDRGERLKDDPDYVAAYLAARDPKYGNKAISTEETRAAIRARASERGR